MRDCDWGLFLLRRFLTGSPAAPYVLLGGILSETREVQLSAFQEMQLGPSQWRISEISWQYEDWRVADSELPTAMAVAPDGTIWVGCWTEA